MKIIILTIFLVSSIFANIAVVSAYKGDAIVDRDGKILKVKLGMKIEKKDIIKTKNNTKVQLLFKDDTTITIGKNAKFSTLSYLYDEKDLKKAEAKFNFSKGFFRTVTGRIGKINPKRFNIKIKSATLGIRGTRFDVFVSNDIIKAALFDGKIFLEVGDTIQNVFPGQMVIYQNNNIDVQDGILDESKEIYAPKKTTSSITKEIKTDNINEYIDVATDDINDIVDDKKDIIYDDNFKDDFKDDLSNVSEEFNIENLSQDELDKYLASDFDDIADYKTPTSNIDNLITNQATASYIASISGTYTNEVGATSTETGDLSLSIDFGQQTVSGEISNLTGDADEFNTQINTANSEVSNSSFSASSFSNTNISEDSTIDGNYYGDNAKVVAGTINLINGSTSSFNGKFIGKQQ